jgi:hypothetical protein
VGVVAAVMWSWCDQDCAAARPVAQGWLLLVALLAAASKLRRPRSQLLLARRQRIRRLNQRQLPEPTAATPPNGLQRTATHDWMTCSVS